MHQTRAQGPAWRLGQIGPSTAANSRGGAGLASGWKKVCDAGSCRFNYHEVEPSGGPTGRVR
eukprot:11003867-Lingulodinium_polyedra.AAC.1